MRLSYQFTLNTGFATSMISTLLETLMRKGIFSAMMMFGEGIFTVLTPEKEAVFLDIIKPYIGKGRVFSCQIDPEGVRIVQSY